MKRLLVAVVAIVTIGAALYVVLGRGAGPGEQLPPAPPPPPPRVVGPWSPPPRAELTLTVAVTRDGKPAADVAVRVGPRSVKTGADGTVRLRLEPGPVELVATAGTLSARRALTLSPLVGDARVELPLSDGAALEVTAVDRETGRPLAGANVEVHVSAEEPRQVLATAVTGDDGRARVTGLDRNEYLVTLTREGFGDVRCVFMKAPGKHELRMLARQAATARVLLPDGGPAAGAEATTIPSGWEAPSSGTAGPHGELSLPVSPNGGRVCARLPGLVGGGPLWRDGGVIVLGPQRRLSGRVVRADDDAPLAGVAVRHEVGALTETATSDTDGRFTLGALCGDWPLAHFELDGYVSELEALEDGETVALSAPAAVRGRVVDDEGRPVANAHVELEDPRSVALTDADGRFGFPRVKREVHLRVKEGERGGFLDTLVDVGQLVEVTISVGPVLVDVPVEVVVDGKPASGVWKLEAVRIDGRKWQTSTLWVNGGRIVDVIYATSLKLPEGSFDISATEENYRHEPAGGSGSAEYRVDLARADPAPIRIPATRPPPPPPPPTRPLRVRVLAPSGAPLPDAGVECIGETPAWTKTGADGTAACGMPVDAKLPTDVRVRYGKAVATAKPVDWSAEVVLRVDAPMTIRGRVTGDAGAGAFINLTSWVDLDSFPVRPEFVLEDLPSVRSILCVQNAANVVSACAVVVPDGGPQDVTLSIGPPGTVRFTVIDPQGQVVPSPKLYVDRMSHPAVTDATGLATLALAPGTHLLVVNVFGSPAPWEGVLTVHSGRTLDLGRIQVQ